MSSVQYSYTHICLKDLFSEWNEICQSVKKTGKVSAQDWQIILFNHFYKLFYFSCNSLELLLLWFYYTFHNTQITTFLEPNRLHGKVLLGKPTVNQLVKKFPTNHETWKVVTIFTKAHYWTIPWARWTQFTFLNPISLISISVLLPQSRQVQIVCLEFCRCPIQTSAWAQATLTKIFLSPTR